MGEDSQEGLKVGGAPMEEELYPAWSSTEIVPFLIARKDWSS